MTVSDITSQIRVNVSQVSKRYNIYERPVDRLREILVGNRQSFHREYWALRDIDIQFHQGITALIGPNGSGKSTLLQIIAGVLEPTAGTVVRNGRITAILELGAGFQSEYTGRENVVMNAMILGVSKTEIEKLLPSIAAFAELGDFFDQPIKTYSSGMVVRLAFATAVSVEPEILLVDEALAVGDVYFQNKCKEHIWAMKNAGKTIIFVSHDMHAVAEWCQHAVLLNGGQIVKQGSVEEVLPLYRELMDDHSLVKSKEFTLPVSAYEKQE
ncbi:MAG: ABC transporter ATP-binding protein [Candidatus Obscuribacterales bacterium]